MTEGECDPIRNDNFLECEDDFPMQARIYSMLIAKNLVINNGVCGSDARRIRAPAVSGLINFLLVRRSVLPCRATQSARRRIVNFLTKKTLILH